MKLRIGSTTIEVATFKEASLVYCAARDASGLGASQFPPGRLPGHHVSYNGRVWQGSAKAWKPGAVPVYDPRVDQVARQAGEALEQAFPWGYRSNDGP